MQSGTGVRRILALTSDGDVFATAGTAAVFMILRHRACDFVRVNPAIGRSLREIPRPAIGLRGMGAAFFASGEALIDPIAVRLVGDDENPAVGPCCGACEQQAAGQKRWNGSHGTHPDKRRNAVRAG